MPAKTIAYASAAVLPANPVPANTATEDKVIDLSIGQGPLPVASVQLYGGARDPNDNGATFTWAWAILDKPAGSAAALSNATTQNPTFGPIDIWGNYRLQMVATSSGLGGASEGNKLKSPKTANVTVRVKSVKKALQKSAKWERDWFGPARDQTQAVEELAAAAGANSPYTVTATADGTPSILGYLPGQIGGAFPVLRAHAMFYFKDTTNISKWAVFLGDAGKAADSYSFKLYSGNTAAWQGYAPAELAGSVATFSAAADNAPKGVVITPGSAWQVPGDTWVGVVCTAAPGTDLGGQLSATLCCQKV